MEILSLGRAGGKTHKLLEWTERNGNAILLTHSIQERDRLQKLVVDAYEANNGACVREGHLHVQADLALRKSQIVWYQNYLRVAKNRTIRRPLFVDNLDLIFMDMFGQVPTTATMTEPVRVVYGRSNPNRYPLDP